ncbi:hypothetical protein [Roseateles cavernae]|uniref:hypothetical protein n=1 Tax=Roseateles cavernae TaxID=3153578 RepID=UPI0032E4BAD5
MSAERTPPAVRSAGVLDITATRYPANYRGLRVNDVLKPPDGHGRLALPVGVSHKLLAFLDDPNKELWLFKVRHNIQR